MSARRQVSRFVIAGLAATGADALTYMGLLATVLPGRFDVAKASSFVVGTLVSYVINKYWTFERPEGSAKEAGAFFALYGITLVLNVAVNRGALEVLPVGWGAPVAFVIATGASTVANFLGQKLWVFREGG